MANADLSVLCLGAENSDECSKALAFCESNFAACTSMLGRWGDPLPQSIRSWTGDYILSYLSRWVIPVGLLNGARIAAMNFHPGPPEYPGIGCNNFALYEEAIEYGVTCHHMAPQVDKGPIIEVRRFPIFAADDVASLLTRTYECQLELFHAIVGSIIRGDELPRSDERWTREPFTRRQLDDLGKITPDMTREEIARRIRATSYRDWQPTIELGGYTFRLVAGRLVTG